MRSIFSFTCPSCGAREQSFSTFNSLNRSVRKSCRRCGCGVESVLTEGRYVLLLLYAHVLAVIAAFPFVLAVIGNKWGLALTVVIVFALLVLAPAMVIHAKNVVRCAGTKS